MSNHDMPGNDYVSVAKFRLEGVHDWQTGEGLTDATAIATALDAQTQATLALAYEQHTANLIAAREFISIPDSEIAERLDRPEPPKPAPVEHYRVGPARCNCGYDAYKISGIMIDYAEEFSMHLARNR